MGEKIVNVNVRFPESIRDRVKSYAGRDRRSMNAEILALLEEAMAARDQGRPDSPSLMCAEKPPGYQTD